MNKPPNCPHCGKPLETYAHIVRATATACMEWTDAGYVQASMGIEDNESYNTCDACNAEIEVPV